MSPSGPALSGTREDGLNWEGLLPAARQLFEQAGGHAIWLLDPQGRAYMDAPTLPDVLSVLEQ